MTGSPSDYMQHLFVNSLQPKIWTKLQLTVGWSRKPVTELVEIAQHHCNWDNTEQIICRMHERLMVSQVSHTTHGTNRGERSSKGSSQKEKGCQRCWPSYHEQSHRPPFSNHENCFLCDESGHWVRNCPNKVALRTLPRHLH